MTINALTDLLQSIAIITLTIAVIMNTLTIRRIQR